VLAELCQAQEASINYISPPQTKNPDESITLNCTVIKPKDINVSWLKDSTMLTLGGVAVFQNPRFRITVDEASNTYSLHIQNLTATDTGRYKCQINFDLSRVIAKEVDLQVTRPPIILDVTETNVRVSEGQSATLLCKADGYPKPEIVWKRDNEDIFFSKGNTYSGANLTIFQVKKEDRGRYICEANNGIGEPVSKSVLLEVSFGPIMSAKRPKVGQKQGYEAELICKVTSYPPAAVSWVRDDKELNNNEHFEIAYLGVTNEETISTLKLKSVADRHYGDYVCKAKNAFGNDETTLELFESEIPVFPFKFWNAHV